MTNKRTKPSPLAPLGGVVVGIAVFLGVNITSGRAIIPTPESVASGGDSPISKVVYPQAGGAQPAQPAGPYQTVCATCHRADGKGMPGAFPPLAGSEWITGNPEVPIRIAILGLSGPIEVAGATFNSTMPPPPGLSDEQIAEAITFARTNFGNNAPKVDAEQVKQVRAALAGRTAPFTAEELKPLLGGAGEAAPAGEAAATATADGGAPAGEEPAPGNEEPGPGEAPPEPEEAVPAAPSAP